MHDAAGEGPPSRRPVPSFDGNGLARRAECSREHDIAVTVNFVGASGRKEPAEVARARIRSSSSRWERGWPPGLVPGALLWAVGLLGFIAAVSGPLNVQVLVAAVLFAGRGFVLLMTSEVEGR
jgi:hypothetical protein